MRQLAVLGGIAVCMALGWGHDHARMAQRVRQLAAQVESLRCERDALAASLAQVNTGVAALQFQMDAERRTADAALAALEEREAIMGAADSRPATANEVVDDATSAAAAVHIDRAFDRLRRRP